MKVSVIIPTKNRASLIERTINSVKTQKTDHEIEVVVVDDASNDNTFEILQLLQKNITQLKVIRNSRSFGGAVSRNIGASYSTGEIIAFLDSDDEWKENHIEKKINLINSTRSAGCFGSFLTVYPNKIVERNLPKFNSGDSMVKYLFQRNGDARTSTFVFVKSAFDKIEFDENLKKHQDWDLAIRFSDVFKLVVDYDENVIIHNDVQDRMSNSNNHLASKYFFNKHYSLFDLNSIYYFYFRLTINTLKFEGTNNYYFEYLGQLTNLKVKKSLRHKMIYLILRTPVIRDYLGKLLRSKL
jgi:glycosyltransferase involved in cell wall biosynthesis